MAAAQSRSDKMCFIVLGVFGEFNEFNKFSEFMSLISLCLAA